MKNPENWYDQMQNRQNVDEYVPCSTHKTIIINCRIKNHNEMNDERMWNLHCWIRIQEDRERKGKKNNSVAVFTPFVDGSIWLLG